MLVALSTLPSGTEARGGSRKSGGSIPYIRKEQLNQYIQEQQKQPSRAFNPPHPPTDPNQQQQSELNWQSYSETIEFLPMMMDTDKATTTTSTSTSTSNKKRTLEGDDNNDDGLYTYDNPLQGLHEDDDTYKVQPFVTGYDEYDEYQQAWRMLGFIIDCHEQNLRSYDDDNNSHDNGDEDEGTGQGCYRYVMWAAVRSVCVVVYGFCFKLLSPLPVFVASCLMGPRLGLLFFPNSLRVSLVFLFWFLLSSTMLCLFLLRTYLTPNIIFSTSI